jgi:hypothetical protein
MHTLIRSINRNLFFIADFKGYYSTNKGKKKLSTPKILEVKEKKKAILNRTASTFFPKISPDLVL